MTKSAAGRHVGFVGLGNMGIPMTKRLVAAGYHVRGFDTSEEARHAFAASPSGSRAREAPVAAGEGAPEPVSGGGVTAVAELGDVGEGAEAVILMLPDSDVVERVVPGLLASLAPGSTIIDMSSSDPARTRVLARHVAGAGMTLIDAPVSGGVSGARAGTLMIMVGGPAAVFERFKPMLTAMGKKVVHAGDTGAGHAVKALNNLMSAAHLLASSEALIAGRRFGLDPAVMLEIVNGASGRSGSTENKWPNYVLTEKYDAGFSVRLMVKDLRLALGIERATGVPAAASEAVVATWEAALADLPPDADHTAIARWLADRAEEQ